MALDNKENEACAADSNNETEKVVAPAPSDMKTVPSADIEKVSADLLQSRTDLLGRVQTLKKDLQDWRGKLDTQVKTYRQELGDLRTVLNSEVESLRSEFQALRTTLKRQLDASNSLAEMGPKPLEEAAKSTP